MIGIKINNEWLDLPGNLSIKMVEKSPLFSNTLIEGSFSFPFSLPETDTNKKLLKFPERLNNTENFNSQLDADLYVEGNLFFRGKLQRLKSNRGEYRVNFIKDVGFLANAIKGKEIDELTLGNMEQLGSPYLSWKINDDAEEGDMVTLNLQRIAPNVEGYYYEQPFITSKVNTLQLLADKVNNNNGFAYWNNTSSYTVNADPFLSDFVAHNNKLWECVQNHTGVEPGTDEDYWIEYSFYSYNSRYYNATAGIRAVVVADRIFIYDLTWNTREMLDQYLSGGNYLDEPNNDYGAYEENNLMYLYLQHFKDTANQIYPEKNYAVAPVRNLKFTDFTGYKLHQNNFFADNLAVTGYILNDGFNPYRNSITPFVFVRAIIDKILETLNINVISTDFLDDEELYRLILYTNKGADRNSRNPSSSSIFNGFDFSNDISKFLPDITIENFLLAIKNTFFLGIILNSTNNTIKFVYLKNILSSTKKVDYTNYLTEKYEYDLPSKTGFTLSYKRDSTDSLFSGIKTLKNLERLPDVDTIDDLPTVITAENLVVLVKENNSFYSVQKVFTNTSVEVTYEWTFYSYNWLDLQLGEGVKKYDTHSTTLVMFRGIDDNEGSEERSWLIPQCETVGHSDYYQQGINPCGLRFLFYRGLQKNSLEVDYPMASSDVFDYEGNQIGNYALRFDGPNGIYQKFGKEWLTFLDNKRDVNYKANLPTVMLKNFEWDLKIQKDNNEFLCRELKYDITHNGIKNQSFDLSKL
jgi:hypothetical protein